MADMAEILRSMAETTSRKNRVKINRKGAKVFKEALHENYNVSMKHSADDDVIETLTTDTTTGGAVGVGFSKKGKKAYLARFQNDGWIPRNQYGGPYKYHPGGADKSKDSSGGLPMVPGKHFWEKTAHDEGVDKSISEAEVKELDRLLRRAAGGGQP